MVSSWTTGSRVSPSMSCGTHVCREHHVLRRDRAVVSQPYPPAFPSLHLPCPHAHRAWCVAPGAIHLDVNPGVLTNLPPCTQVRASRWASHHALRVHRLCDCAPLRGSFHRHDLLQQGGSGQGQIQQGSIASKLRHLTSRTTSREHWTVSLRRHYQPAR